MKFLREHFSDFSLVGSAYYSPGSLYIECDRISEFYVHYTEVSSLPYSADEKIVNILCKSRNFFYLIIFKNDSRPTYGNNIFFSFDFHYFFYFHCLYFLYTFFLFIILSTTIVNCRYLNFW